MSFYLVKIDDEMVRSARSHQAAVVKSRARSGKSASNEKYFYDFLGELSFSKFLIINGKKFNHLPRGKGRRKGFRFVLNKKSGGILRADTVTLSKAYYRNMMISESKFVRDRCEIYVAIKIVIETGFAEIYGFSHADQIFKSGIQSGLDGRVYSLPINALSCIENFIETLENEAVEVPA